MSRHSDKPIRGFLGQWVRCQFDFKVHSALKPIQKIVRWRFRSIGDGRVGSGDGCSWGHVRDVWSRSSARRGKSRGSEVQRLPLTGYFKCLGRICGVLKTRDRNKTSCSQKEPYWYKSYHSFLVKLHIVSPSSLAYTGGPSTHHHQPEVIGPARNSASPASPRTLQTSDPSNSPYTQPQPSPPVLGYTSQHGNCKSGAREPRT
jgi:hypothetical protein